MSDWSGQIDEAANPRGLWMRGGSLVVEVPSLPGDLDDVPLYPTSVDEDFEATDTTAVPVKVLNALRAVTPPAGRGHNRAPATQPPPPSRQHGRPQPQRLFDEAPDPGEKTPPTFDMGLLPATWADAEITEEAQRPRAQMADPASAVLDDAFSVIQPLSRVSAAVAAEREMSGSLELEDDWLESSPDDLDLYLDPVSLPAPQAEPPRPARAPAPGLAARAPAPGLAARAPAPGLAARAPAPGLAARAPAPGLTARAPARAEARRAPIQRQASRFANVDTAPIEPLPITIGAPARASLAAQAGWWCAGAVVGVTGASAIAALTFAVVLLA